MVANLSEERSNEIAQELMEGLTLSSKVEVKVVNHISRKHS